MTKEEKIKARECAVEDIQSELTKSNRCFVNYIEELDPVMDYLVDRYEEAQMSSFIINVWTY